MANLFLDYLNWDSADWNTSYYYFGTEYGTVAPYYGYDSFQLDYLGTVHTSDYAGLSIVNSGLYACDVELIQNGVTVSSAMGIAAAGGTGTIYFAPFQAGDSVALYVQHSMPQSSYDYDLTCTPSGTPYVDNFWTNYVGCYEQ